MKSISIKTKLAILVIIPLIAALIVTVLGLFYVNKISSNLTQSLYNEGFQSISLVLNADRDLYQALDSVNGLLMENSKGVLDPASKEEFIAGYEENAVQTSDRVKEAVDLLSENKEFWSEIKDDSGANVFDHYASFEENFAKWEEMSAGITTTYVSTEEWTAQFDSSREDMNVIGELVEVGIQKSITDNEASKTDMVTMMILIDVVVLALVLFLSIFIIRAITIPLKKSVTMLQEMVKGRLSHRLNLNQKDEIGIMADTLDQYAENLQLNVIGTMKKISEGDLNMDIQITDSEDEISPVMKLTVDNLKALVSEAEMLTAAAMEGNLSARGNADAFQGGYYHILAGVNSTLDSVIGPLNVAADYMDRISKGDIPPVITDEYHGDFDQIKNNINTCINAINSLVEDMDILSVATVKGDLLVRSDAGKHSGDFAKIVEGVNLTLDTLVGFIDEMPAPVMIINNDYDIQYMNKIGSSILGKTQNELTGQKCYDNFKTSHCRTENCSCARAMKLDDKVTAETDAHPNGMDLEISYTGRPIKDRNNNIIGAVELIVDQTDIKRAAKLAEKQAEYQLVEVERLIYNLEKISVGDLDLSLKIGEVDEDTAIVGQNFEKINSSLSQSVDALKSMMEDVNMLAQAAVEGRLDTRADAAHHQGDYRKIVEGVNGTLNAVIEPIKEASEVLQEMAKGNLKVGMFGNYQGDLDDLKTALNQTISSMVTYMTEIATVLTKMGQGNLNQAITADYRGDFVVMKESLNGILESLNDVLGDINEAAEQVASGSRQVSDGSQALSQGSTEQASSIQELTASIIELADQTKQNAVNANQASTLAETAKSNAERGNDQMKEMLTSMSDINDSSANISKIIKVIDDIAFQTNILALNAAVEAARAGQHGKGFAVVAEEVRNLAARSADAAKETTALIEGSINKVQTGTKIANETAAALIEIVDGIEKSASLISNIAESSNNQASGISQINRGIEQVSQVVQNNAATAEESAASSEELSSQAELLKQMVGRFELNGAKALKNAGTKLLGSSTPRAAAVSDYQILLSDDEYDKY